MRLTLSVIKADVGSVGGHTKPSARMMATVGNEVAKAIDNGLLIDPFVCHTGDEERKHSNYSNVMALRRSPK